MSTYSFQDIMQKDSTPMTISPGCRTENKGFFTNLRVDRNTLPAGWYAYDIRTSDAGNFCALEQLVRVNHGGTFLTQTPVKMNKHGYHSLARGAGYTFS